MSHCAQPALTILYIVFLNDCILAFHQCLIYQFSDSLFFEHLGYSQCLTRKMVIHFVHTFVCNLHFPLVLLEVNLHTKGSGYVSQLALWAGCINLYSLKPKIGCLFPLSSVLCPIYVHFHFKI